MGFGWSNQSRQPIAVSDISVYICLIDIRSKSKEQLNERRAGLSRIVNRLLVAFDKGWICLGAGAKTEASQQTATLANMTESGYDRNTHTKN